MMIISIETRMTKWNRKEKQKSYDHKSGADMEKGKCRESVVALRVTSLVTCLASS